MDEEYRHLIESACFCYKEILLILFIEFVL